MIRLEDLRKHENMEELKELAKIENLDQLEAMVNDSDELRGQTRSLNIMGSCGKMIYVALKTVEPKDMTVSEITNLVNNVFGLHWSKKNVKCFLERLESVGLVTYRVKKWRAHYKLNGTGKLG